MLFTSPVSPVFHTEVAVSIGILSFMTNHSVKSKKSLTLSLPTISLFWEQERKRAEFQTEVHDPYPEHNGEQK